MSSTPRFRACVMVKNKGLRLLKRDQGVTDADLLDLSNVDPADYDFHAKCYSCEEFMESTTTTTPTTTP